jgi:hypothetical protein
MLQCGRSVRFTAEEIEEGRKCGLDLRGVKTDADLARAEIELISTLAEERPALLERIAAELARGKGVELPPRLATAP